MPRRASLANITRQCSTASGGKPERSFPEDHHAARHQLVCNTVVGEGVDQVRGPHLFQPPVGTIWAPADKCETRGVVQPRVLKWWSMLDLNQRPPACEAGALPTELIDRDEPIYRHTATASTERTGDVIGLPAHA